MPPKLKKETNTKNSKNNLENNSDNEYSEIDEFDEDEFYEKKINEFDDIKYKMYNPDTFTSITHKEINIVPKNERRTSNIITQYEFTEVVSIRSKQIEDGSRIFIDIKKLSDPIEIAEREIKEKRCPLTIRRMLCDEIAEIWEVNEMIIPY